MNYFEVTSLKGNNYIYDSDYNIIQPSDLYCRQTLEEVASTQMIIHKEISCNEFFNDKKQRSFMQLCLVLTNQCNFRCNYCINSDEYKYSKGFKNEHMSKEIIDHALELYVKSYKEAFQWNPNLSFVIGFYGGEPLLKYDLICYTIERVKKVYNINDAKYTLTTNAYLLNREKFDYLSKNNVYINVSFDGYEEYHDLNRKTIDGKKTFKRVVENFRSCLQNETEGKLSILMTQDMRFSPLKMHEFFLENDDLDKRITRVNSVADINTGYYERYEAYPKFQEEFDQLFNIYMMSKRGKDEKISNFVKQYFDGLLLDISKRLHFNDKLCSICTPLKSRLTVSTDGKLHICEKVNENYSIGDVFNGVDVDLSYKYYSRLCYIRKNVCKDCEIRNICGLCYAQIQRDGNEMNIDESFCKNAIKGTKNALKYYCTTLEY
ncbi:radical SAM protein [Clostridium sp. C8-1-8]|uniref:radical SAM protein n=1 Tax=Clostridium sp. C8-1-8 TaxID=2698831 RepID=UPI001371F589|nr:radical SAM protein [Clostridium sp. C8-1-8]